MDKVGIYQKEVRTTNMRLNTWGDKVRFAEVYVKFVVSCMLPGNKMVISLPQE